MCRRDVSAFFVQARDTFADHVSLNGSDRWLRLSCLFTLGSELSIQWPGRFAIGGGRSRVDCRYLLYMLHSTGDV